MSDHEFENYLTLIGRLLRLSSTQREAIGEELRDHFELRVSELTNRGRSHAEAVRLALEEFGDAAGLAAQFSSISQTRKRRMIMRCTVASVAALAAIVVIAISLWPENHAPQFIDQAVAESAQKQIADNLDTLSKAAAESIADNLTAQTSAKLNTYVEMDFANNPTPLNECLEYIKDKFNLQIYVNKESLNSAGIDPTSTTVQIGFSHIRLRLFLELMLREKGLGFTVHDGIIFIASKDTLMSEMEIRVYDCRAILAADASRPHDSALAATEKKWSDADPRAHRVGTLPESAKPSTDPIAKNVAGGAAVPNSPMLMTSVDNLMGVITGIIDPETWSVAGGNGTIQPYNGLLIVRQTAEGQSKVVDLLDQISAHLPARPAK